MDPTTNKLICQQKNNCHLPPLQFAIFHKNIKAIEYLLNEGIRVTYKDEDGKLILSEHDALPLHLIYIRGIISKSKFYVGFMMKKGSSVQWVVSELPDLNKTMLLKPSTTVNPLDGKSIKTALEPILKCHCPQPLLIAFKQKLIEPNTMISDMHLSQYISSHGTVENVEQYLELNIETLYEGVENRKSMIESAIENPEVLKILLEFLLSQRQKGIPLDETKITDCLSNSLKLSVESNDIKALELLLDHVEKFNYTYTNNCETLLQLTLAQGEKPKFLEAILKKLAGLSDQRYTYIEDKKDVLIPFIDWKNNDTHTALHICVLKGLTESLDILLETSNLSISDSEGNTALHLAVKKQNLSIVQKIVQRILEVDAGLLNKPNENGCTPLHLAVECENIDITQYFLEKEAAYNLTDNYGHTILHYAVKIVNPDPRKSLIDCILMHPTTKPLTRECDIANGYTPLHLAVVLQYFNAVKIILEADQTCLKIRDKHEQTALHIAVIPKNNHFEYSLNLEQPNHAIFDEIFNTIEKEEKLLTDPNEVEKRLTSYRDNEGKTVVHLCLKFQNPYALSKLLDTNPCLNLTDKIGNTPIHEAVLIQNETAKDCLDLLLKAINKFHFEEQREYLYALNKSQLTPLHSAIRENNKIAIECLQKHDIQLAFISTSSKITLLDGIEGFSLDFLEKKDVGEFYTGYAITFLQVDYWVVSQMPKLETFHIFNRIRPDFLHLNESVEAAIYSILKCRSFEPLRAAIRKSKNGNSLINSEGRIKGQHMSQIVAENATKEVMEFYLEDHNWALFNFPDEYSMVECAISNVDHGTLELLLQKLPSVKHQELPSEDDPVPTEHQLVSLCLYKSMKRSIFEDDTEALSLLIKYDARINYTYGPEKDTLLHLIVKNDNIQASFAELILKKLKQTPENDLTHFDKNILFIDAKNNNEKTALHLSIESQAKTKFETILRYPLNLLIQDDNGDTALHLAVKTKQLYFVEDIIKEIIDKTSVMKAKNNDGYTPLHCSIDVAESSIASCLLTNGSDFYTTDHNQQTLLHHAVRISTNDLRIAMIDFISQFEKDTLQKCEIARMQDNSKYCPLQLAVYLQHCNAVESIVQIDSGVLNLRDRIQQSALHLAVKAKQNSEDCVAQKNIFATILNAILIKEERAEEEHWLESRVINYQNSLGKTALHYSLELNDTNALTKLLGAKPNYGLKDQTGNTALHQAVLNCEYVDCLNPLLDAIRSQSEGSYDTHFYLLNNQQIPPLQLAILENNHPSIQILLNGKNQFQLAFVHPKSNKITLCDAIEGFSLTFISRSLTSTCNYFAGYDIKFNDVEYWIVSQLPELHTTCVFEKSNSIEQLNTSALPALLSIMKCRSQEPLAAAFRNELLYPDQDLDNDMFMSQFAGRHATKEVMAFYLENYKNTLFYFGGKLSMIECAISNPELATLELLLETLRKTDTTQGDDNKNVLICLQNSLQLSLENDSNNALALLLEYNSRPNDLYTPQKNTLLHLIIIRDKNPEFIDCLLGKIRMLEGENRGSTKVNSGDFIDVKNKDCKTAIHLSIERQQKSNLETLLKYDPKLNIPDGNKNTALHLTVSIQNLEFVQMIVSEIKKTDQSKLMDAKNNQGCTPLHLAVYFGNVEIVKYLLRNGCDLKAIDHCERTLLHYAVSVPTCEVYEYPHMVDFILELDPSLLSDKDKWKRTPLHLAVIQYNDNIVQILLKAIHKRETTLLTDDSIICYQDYQGKTALHFSIQHINYYALDALLVANPCLDLKDHNDNTILHYATMQPIDGYSIQQVLTSIKTRFEKDFESYLYSTNILQLTPLQLAIKHCHIEAIETLVGKFQASIVHIDREITLNFNDELPLRFYNSKREPNQYYTGYSFHTDITTKGEIFVVCKMPLRFDNLSETEIFKNDEILEIEKINEDLLIQIMLSQSSEPLQAYLKIMPLTTYLSKNSNLMHFAAQYGTPHVLRFLISQFDNLEITCREQDEEGNSILHRAIDNEEIESVKILLEKVRDYTTSSPRIIDYKNKADLYALDVALEKDRLEVFLEYLKVENVAIINYYDPDQNTLLHKVVISHKKRTEEYLTALLYNIDLRENENKGSTFINDTRFIDCYSKNRYTALHLSIIHMNSKAFDILSKNNANLSLPTLDVGDSIVHLAVLCLEDGTYLRIVLNAILSVDNPDYYQLFNTKNNYGYCPLHLAIINSKCEYVRDLLKPTEEPVKSIHHKNVCNEQLYVRREPEGYTPLHYATLLKRAEAIDIINILFKTEEEMQIPHRTILNQRCNAGRTPLHLAISRFSYFPITEHNEDHAVRILNLLFEHADKIAPDCDYLLHLDHDQNSILHHAVLTNNDKIYGCVISKLTMPLLCLNRFGQLLLNSQNRFGRTALLITIEKENYKIFCELLKFHPSLHYRDNVNQWTVLHCAVNIYSKCKDFFEEVLERLRMKKDFQSMNTILDKNCHTALHLAIKGGNENVVEILLQEGAHIAVEKEFGSDEFTIGAYGDGALDVKLGRKGHEKLLQEYVYIITYKVGSKYLVSNLPEFEDTELLDDAKFENDFELRNVVSRELVGSVVASKCPEIVEKMLKDKVITIEQAPETNLMYIAAEKGSKAVMRFLCEEKQPDFDYESKDNYGNTLIHCAANNKLRNVKTLKYILKKTENFEKEKQEKLPRKILSYTNRKKQSALQITINKKKCEFFIALINRGANLTEQNDEGNSILHLLLLEENIRFESVKFIIESIFKNEKNAKKLVKFLSIKNHNDLTVLHIAIMKSSNEIVKFLLKNKASVKDINLINGNTIVHMATVNKWDESDMKTIFTVLKAVRLQDKDNSILSVRNFKAVTPLHISVCVKEKNFMIKPLLEAGVPLEITNRDRNTALHIAAMNEDNEALETIMGHLIIKAREHQLADRRLEYMRELVRENKDKLMPICIPKKKENMKTMLRAWNQYHEVSMDEGRRGLLIHLAIYKEKTELVEAILECLKEIAERHEDTYEDILSSRDTDYMTPIHVAAEIGDERIAIMLIDSGADIQLNSPKGTPVEIAMQRNHIQLALCFVKKGAKINRYLDLLTYDKISDHDIKQMFDQGKMKVNRRISSADCTIIHYAAKQSSVSRIALLLRNNIALTASDRDGRRVLHYAIQYRDNFEVLKFFLDEAHERDELEERRIEKKLGEDDLSYMEALFYHDLDGITPVMLAASLDKIQIFRLLTTPEYEFLLDTLDACDPDENNVVHYLARYKSLKTAKYIIPRIYEYDIHLFSRMMNARNIRGQSPIDLARKRGIQEMVDLFIDHCGCEYFEACPDVVHRMVKGKDLHNFEKVLEKTVIKDNRNVQISTKLMDSNEEGAYPNLKFFNFHLDPLWHKLYKSNEIKLKYHPIVKFLVDEKLTVYKWWFMKLFFIYLFFFYIPFAGALLLASSRCDSELFLYDSHVDGLRFLLEFYILFFTWVYMMNEVFEIFGKYRYLETLDFTTNDLVYQRRHHVQYYDDEESDKYTLWIQKKVSQIFFEFPTFLKERLYRWERSGYFRFFPQFMLRAIYRHFCDTYNIIDMSGVILLFLLFFFRTLMYFNKSGGVSTIHWTISALTFTVFTLKFFKYTKMFPSLGIYIETLSNVLSRDVPRFTLVILIILISYTGSIQQVARTQKPSQCEKGSCSFSDWFNDDSIPFSPITTPLISGVLFIIDGGPGNYEGSIRDVSFIFSILYLIFAFSIIVILLNVFIAQLSQTYSDINSTKNLLDFKADLALEYETQSNILFAFQSPITRSLKRIMVQSIIIPVDVWNEYLDSYLKRISDSTGGSDKENSESEQNDVEKSQSMQGLLHDKFDRLEEKMLQQMNQKSIDNPETTDNDDKNKMTEKEDITVIKKKMEQIEEKLTDLFDFVKQDKSSTKPDKMPQVVSKTDGSQSQIKS